MTCTQLGVFSAMDSFTATRFLAICGGDTRLWLGKLLQVRGCDVGIAMPTNFYEACYSGSLSAVTHFFGTRSEPTGDSWRVSREMMGDLLEPDTQRGCDTSGYMEEIEREWPKSADWGLQCACHMGNIEIARYLIRNGATDYDSGLYAAACEGHIEIIAEMLQHGACISGCIFAACTSCQIESAKFFISVVPREQRDLHWENMSEAIPMEYDPRATEFVKTVIAAGMKPDKHMAERAARCGLTELAEFITKSAATVAK